MKRHGVVKLFSSYLNEDDLAVFAGKDICGDAYLYDRQGNFYMDEESGIGIPMAFGMSMGTEKRVFVFCEDYYFLKNLSTAMHIGVSRCKNIFLIILVSGEYQYSGANPTIFNEISSVKALMFNAGFMINDYTKHFSTVQSSKGIKQILAYIQSPLFAVININLGKSNKMCDVGLTMVEQRKRLTNYLAS